MDSELDVMKRHHRVRRNVDWLINVVLPVHLRVAVLMVVFGWMLDLVFIRVPANRLAGLLTALSVGSLCALASIIFGLGTVESILRSRNHDESAFKSLLRARLPFFVTCLFFSGVVGAAVGIVRWVLR